MPHNIASIRVLERLVVKKRALRKKCEEEEWRDLPILAMI